MSRLARSPNEQASKAHELYNKGMKLVEIANQLNLPPGTVRRWKSTYKWDSERSEKKSERSVRKKGGQLNNKNAVGNRGGAAPLRNNNAVKHGLFEKYLPQETLDIVSNMTLNPLDILWDQIQIAYAAIVRAQNIMFVKDKDEMIKELKKKKSYSSEMSESEEKEWEFQFAWDRQATFMNAQARAQSELRSLIKQYDEMLHSNWELATEEQRLRVDKLKLDIKSQTGDNNGSDGIQDFLKATNPTQEDIDALYADEVIEDEETKEE